MPTQPCDPCADNQPRAWSIRKGTYEMNAVFTGLAGELVAVLPQDKCNNPSGHSCATLAVHDGQTAGGALLMRRDFGCYIPGSLPAGIIADKLLTERMFADGSVSTRALADGAVTTAKLADNAVTSDKIADGAVSLADMNPAAIASIVNQSVVAMQAGDKLSYLQLSDTPDSYAQYRVVVSDAAGMGWAPTMYAGPNGVAVGLGAPPNESTAFVAQVNDGEAFAGGGKKAAWPRNRSSSNSDPVLQVDDVQSDASGPLIRARSGCSPDFIGGDVKFEVTRGGDVKADGAFIGGGADYAEWFRVAPGEALEPGMTVSWDGKQRGVIAADWDDDDLDERLVGVVRDPFDPVLRPLIIGDAPFGADRGVGWVLVGLLGKMPVRDDQPTGDRWIHLYDNIWLVR